MSLISTDKLTSFSRYGCLYAFLPSCCERVCPSFFRAGTLSWTVIFRLAERIEMKRKLYHGSQERAEKNETQLGRGPWQFDAELEDARETLMQVARGMC